MECTGPVCMMQWTAAVICPSRPLTVHPVPLTVRPMPLTVHPAPRPSSRAAGVSHDMHRLRPLHGRRQERAAGGQSNYLPFLSPAGSPGKRSIVWEDVFCLLIGSRCQWTFSLERMI